MAVVAVTSLVGLGGCSAPDSAGSGVVVPLPAPSILASSSANTIDPRPVVTAPPPTITAGTSTTSGDSELAALGRAADSQLQQGQIAYNPPSSAVLDEEFQITVRLQVGVTATSSLLRNLPGPGTVTIEPIKVGAYMDAYLDGPGFVVRPINAGRLALSENDVIEFAWVVRATTPGPHTLTLTLVAEVGAQPAKQRTYSRDITVAVEPAPGPVTQILAWAGWSEVLVGLLVAFLVGCAGWATSLRRRRRRSGGNNSQPPTGGAGGSAVEARSPTPVASRGSDAVALTTAMSAPPPANSGGGPDGAHSRGTDGTDGACGSSRREGTDGKDGAPGPSGTDGMGDPGGTDGMGDPGGTSGTQP